MPLPLTIVGVVVLGMVVNPLLNKVLVPADEEPEDTTTTIERPPFDPRQTDVLGYAKLGFIKPTTKMVELHLGKSFFLSQALPKWIIYLLDTYSSSDNYKTNPNADLYENHTVDILDARKLSDSLSFHETGFTLLKLSQASQTTKWRNAENVKLFQAEILPHLKKLYPDATRIEFTSSIVRGGNWLGDQPAAVNGPHLDYTQDDAARVAFHEEYPINEMVKEHLALLGKWDTEEDEMKTLIGIWKPIYMKNPVYDHPLALMDARTFHKEQERPHRIHFDLGFFQMHNLNGAFSYDPEQKWYYYPFQEDTEVLVFTQYTKDKHFANPHSSFLSPNRPHEDYDSRVSVEMRAAVFFPKTSKTDAIQESAVPASPTSDLIDGDEL